MLSTSPPSPPGASAARKSRIARSNCAIAPLASPRQSTIAARAAARRTASAPPKSTASRSPR
eukprot:3703552-Prymnesium_polylepis.2